MGYVIYLLFHTTYIRYIGHIVHMDYIITQHWVYMYSIYILYKIYSLYYTMGYVISLPDSYNVYCFISLLFY